MTKRQKSTQKNGVAWAAGQGGVGGSGGGDLRSGGCRFDPADATWRCLAFEVGWTNPTLGRWPPADCVIGGRLRLRCARRRWRFRQRFPSCLFSPLSRLRERGGGEGRRIHEVNRINPRAPSSSPDIQQ
ncbi:hypothetical protein CBM2623_B70265 [Cupriavidus taiwanensis]|nr:hypothetical protein CBM2608_B60263 [Cupriavidus taiwanensis]SPA35747.1 hypothetical protein CBM2623_B70265 [Cupriavidus taiwanensis]